MTSIGKPWLHFAFLLLCLFCLWVFSLSNLKRYPIANDEYNTLERFRDIREDRRYSLPQTLENLAAISPDHGPLYFALMNIWARIGGADLFSLRLPSVFFGLLAVATTYRLGLLGGRAWSGLAAVAYLGLLAFFLYYTHIARMYTLLALASGLTVWSYWRASRGGAPRPLWIWTLLFVSSAALLYIHYASVFLLGAVAIYHLIFARKCRRWWRVSALLAASVLLFAPWLPVVFEGLSRSSVLLETPLSLFASIGAAASIFSNGIVILPLALASLILRFRKGLRPAEHYLLFVLAVAFLLVLMLNEFTPLLIESRLRYLTFIAAPAAGSLALGLQFVPGGRRVRILLFCLWAFASLSFARSDYFNVVTNRRLLREDRLVHYQAFLYDLRDLPGYDQLIVSFHPDAQVVWKTAEYYRAVLDKWKYVVHVTYDQEGELLVESGIPPRYSLDDIASDSDGLWVIHNPQQTNINAMDVYANWFMERFKPCHRFIETADNVIEFYLRRSLPCGLAFAERPLAIQYDNGMRLGNLLVEESPGHLSVSFWWDKILDGEYSFSLQVFDQASARVLGSDGLIWRAPADARSLDITSLPAGEYTLQLIVYDSETGESQAGLILDGQRHFDRQVEIARFTVEN